MAVKTAQYAVIACANKLNRSPERCLLHLEIVQRLWVVIDNEMRPHSGVNEAANLCARAGLAGFDQFVLQLILNIKAFKNKLKMIHPRIRFDLPSWSGIASRS